MATYTATSPVPGYGGRTAGVQFSAGVGHTDNVAAARWLAAKGYRVEPDPAAQPSAPAKGRRVEPDPAAQPAAPAKRPRARP